MQIAIIGCGAMGSVYAGLLAEAGHAVLAVTRNRPHVDAINTKGLYLSGASGDRNIPMRAATTPSGPPADLVVIAVKAAQAAEAAEQALPLIGPDTAILTIQNGLGSAEGVANIVGADRLAVGIAAAFGAAIEAPGHVQHASLGAIHVGAFRGLSMTSVQAITEIWQAAGFGAVAAPDIAVMQWEKLICNVAFSGPCAVSGLRVGDMLDRPELAAQSHRAATEAYEVARALGVNLTITDPIAHIQAFARKVAKAKPSVLLDLEAGRKTEIDFINGAIGREGAKCGVPAPVNDWLTAQVHRCEARLTA